ncbi:MAG: UDP-N-acetylmuramate--L-alanine ligase [Streptosporangiaceae bacterium]
MGLVTPVDPVPVSELGRVHFVGIGGAGMSGIARIMLARGIPVSGSDSAASPGLDELAELGARVAVGHAAENLGDLGAADTLVVSSAIRPDNPELVQARRRGLRVLHRAAALASVMAGRRVIAVAGTHGKTTTTSMLTTVLRDCGADPGYVIGGVLLETGLGADDGAGMDFVAEADESDGSFLLLSPDMAIITNVEADHLDNYGSLAEIEAAFVTFGSHVSSLVLTCADDPGAEAVAARLEPQSPQRVRRYGESVRADYRLGDVHAQGLAVSFAVTADHSPFGEIFAQMTVHVPGHHNALNATAAFAAAVELGFAPPRVTAALARYQGARRRMELKGEADGVRVFDSYAHHPTELAADLRAARDITPEGRVIAIFQPHLYSRTRIFAGDFGAALGLADQAVVLDVYAAREDPEPGVTGRLVADAVPGGRALFLPDRTQVAPLIARIAEPGDVVLTMGAGDVTALGPQLVEAVGRRPG